MSCASLVIGAPDQGRGDPQVLPRVSLQGAVSALAPGDDGFERARDLYLARLPRARPRFEFADFVLMRMRLDAVQYVGGFGRAAGATGEEFRAPLSPGSPDASE